MRLVDYAGPVGIALAVLLAALVVRQLTATAAELRLLDGEVRRQRAWCAEAERFVRTRTRIADAATTTAVAVQRGSAATQAGHRLIAAIPFGILGRIPATSQRSGRIQRAHDDRAEKVYDGISSFADRVSVALRQRLVGPEE